MAKPFSTLVELFENSLHAYAPNEALGEKTPDGSWGYISYRDFGVKVDEARAGLAALGVEKGDRVGIIADNSIAWAVSAFAIFTAGACCVPMYEAQQPEDWEFILGDCDAKVCIVADERIYQALKDRSPRLPQLTHVIGIKLPSEHPDSLAQLRRTGALKPAPRYAAKPQDLAAFLYTSGTTGNPKGVKLSHGNISSNVSAASARFDFRSGDVSLSFLPWAHAFGQVAELYSFIQHGLCITINDAVPNLISNLPEVRPTILVAVPRIFNRIYDGVNKQMTARPAPIRALFHAGLAAAKKAKRGQSLSLTEKLSFSAADRLIFSKIRQKFGGRLRFVVSGSAALSVEVAEFIDALGIDVFEGYGLTETSPVISVNYPGHRKVGSIGPPLPDVHVTIDTQVTGDPKQGEIVVSGPNVMQGYHNRPEENAAVFTATGALRTGDMGYLDEDGFLYITGRIKEQYKLENGKYVVPSPLEEQLKLSPLIANVMLFGDNREYNVALVVPDLTNLREYAAEHGFELGDVTTNPKVAQVLQAELDRYSENFKGYERPKKIAVTTEDFTTENGQLTHSLKIKRRVVLSVYGARLEALYRA